MSSGSVRAGHGSDALVHQCIRQVQSWDPVVADAHGLRLLDAHPSEHATQEAARRVLAAAAIARRAVAMTDEPVLMTKGVEVAALYPRLYQRHFRDVDLLTGAAVAVWDGFRDEGWDFDRRRVRDPGHHHLPALKEPRWVVSIEVHRRPNCPDWASAPVDEIIEMAEPSRLEIVGLHRPRDDHHALLVALHAWKSGLSRYRDLLDYLLLAELAGPRLTETAEAWGLGRLATLTHEIARAVVLGEPMPAAVPMAAPHLPGRQVASRRQQRWAELVGPVLAVGPKRATLGTGRRMGRRLRRNWERLKRGG